MNNQQKALGFTLLEAVIIVTIIGILAGISIPRIFITGAQTKEAVLKHTIQDVRKVIAQYEFENGARPTDPSQLAALFINNTIPNNPTYLNGNSVCHWDDEDGSDLTCSPYSNENDFCNSVKCPPGTSYGSEPYQWVYHPNQAPYFWAANPPYKFY